jgi:hypothetical protein
MDNKKVGDPPKDDDEPLFDPTTAVDAGVGEEMQAADAEVKVKTVRKVEKLAKIEHYLRDVQSEPDIVERGRKLAQGELVSFPDIKRTSEGFTILNCDSNRLAAFNALFGDDRPHINTFSGRLVDWRGEVIDDQYSMVPMLHALHAMGLKLQSLDAIRKTLRDWGLQVKKNDLIEQFSATLPVWDGVSRLEEKLITLFGCFDTPLNRSFGKYFWLSLYCRVTQPGCMAPMVLSLFGGQNVGKSYFSTLICRILTANPKAISIQLDMGANKIDFLRDITGHAIVANIGEMTGFSRTDLNAIKSFITATSDSMHQKFEGHFQQARQWIAIMDGNKYEGLQRDDTGNRRFYPMFVGQIEDKHGQPNWDEDYVADFTDFDSELWQVMSECRAWLEANNGMDGYNNLVNAVSRDVKEFSQNEMMRGRGAVVDYSLDTYLIPCLMSLRKLNASIIDGRKNKGVWITTAAIRTRIKTMGKGVDIKENHLKTKMLSLGATPELIKNVRGYLFKDIMSEKDYLARIGCVGDDGEEESEIKFTEDEEF